MHGRADGADGTAERCDAAARWRAGKPAEPVFQRPAKQPCAPSIARGGPPSFCPLRSSSELDTCAAKAHQAGARSLGWVRTSHSGSCAAAMRSVACTGGWREGFCCVHSRSGLLDHGRGGRHFVLMLVVVSKKDGGERTENKKPLCTIGHAVRRAVTVRAQDGQSASFGKAPEK